MKKVINHLFIEIINFIQIKFLWNKKENIYYTEKMRWGYSIPTVIFILTFISLVLGATIGSVTISLQRSAAIIKDNNSNEMFFSTLNEVVKDFGSENQEEGHALAQPYTSPFDGWFSELPEEKNGFKLSYFPEDSKLDINYLDVKTFFNIDPDLSTDRYQNADLVNKLKDTILFQNENLTIKTRNNLELIFSDHFSIYKVPNLNTASIDRLKLYMENWNFEKTLIDAFINKMTAFKGINQNNYKYNYAGTAGLIIDNFKFSDLKSLNWPEDRLMGEDIFYILFDMKGNINLNFVSKEVFITAAFACLPANSNTIIDNAWKKIEAKQKAKVSIEGEQGIKDIFTNNYFYYINKVFSVDSNLFIIRIEKDNKVLTAYIRRYKTRETHTWILKTNIGVDNSSISGINPDENLDNSSDASSDVF